MLTFHVKAQIEDGDYLSSDSHVEKISVLNRKDGSIRLGKTHYGYEQENYIFKQIDESFPVFEGEGDRTSYRLEDKDGVILLYTLEESRLITSVHVLAQDRKSLKVAMKKMGIKSAAKLEMEAMFNKNKTPEPIKQEYLVQNPTSDFHKEHVNQIVFFSEKPEIGKEDKTKIKTSFKVGEPVWAIAYLPTKLEVFVNLHNSDTDIFGNTTRELCIGMDKLDENLLEEEMPIVNSCPVKRLSKEDLELNYAIFQVIPALQGEHEMYKHGVEFMTERLGERVESYEHTFEVVLTDASKVTYYKKSEITDIEFIKGEFQFDASAGMESYTAFSKGIANAELANKRLPTAAFRDAEIERQMMQQIEFYAHNKQWDVDLKRVIITSNWQVLRDDYGNVLGNYIEGVVLYSHDEGCTYMNFGFLQEHLGGGNFSDTLRQYDIGNRGDVSCDKI